MKHKLKRNKHMILAGLLAGIILLLAGCGQDLSSSGTGDEASPDTPMYSSYEELSGKTVGLYLGTVAEEVMAEKYPDIKRVYLGGPAVLLMALHENRIDGFVMDEYAYKRLTADSDEITCMEEPLCQVETAIVFSNKNKGSDVHVREFNEFLAKVKTDGTMDQMLEDWSSNDESRHVINRAGLTGERGILKMCAAMDNQPFVYLENNKASGLEVQLIYDFCREYGYGLTVEQNSFEGMLTGMASGAYDVACGAMQMSDERREAEYRYSDTVVTMNMVTIVKKQSIAKRSFFASLKASFYKNFIREDRYKMVLEGVGVTILITVLSAILGTLLGFGVFVSCRRGNKVANAISSAYVWLMQGMPVVVLLMLLYYVILSPIKMSGTWVSVIAFTLVTGASVFGMLKTGTSAIDSGQMEAALALGYPETKGFYKMVLPQAIQIVLPSYQAELVALVKATAVVGYIAVQDLTRVSDLIRSRTYEAMMPLLTTAVLYFILGGILTKIVKLATRRIDTRTRTEQEILKGVDVR